MKNFVFALLLMSVPALAATSELDPLYSDVGEKVRAPANAWPEELAADFVVSEPDRGPASINRKVQQQVKPKTAAKPLNRRSRLPAAVSDGFELRVRYNKLTSMFWVVKRENKFDLLFTNSGGSKANLSLPAEGFKQLQTIASRLPASDQNISKCQEASMQMHYIEAGRPERTTTMCVNDKSKAGAEMRNLSQALATLVR